MKPIFFWSPLKPPDGKPRMGTRFANGLALAWGLVGLVMVVFGLDAGLPLYLPMLASVLLFGLPHGAIDHLVVLGLAKRSLSLKALALVCLIYLSFVVAMLCLWWLAPLVAMFLFLGITIYHWGRADLAFEGLLNPAALQNTPRILKFNHSLLRGIFPIGIPFLAFPDATEAILNSCSAAFGYEYELGTTLPFVILIALILLLFSELAYLRDQGEQRNARLAEDLGLIAFFVLVPPVLAIGLYFCLWHGFRHVLRLIRYEGNEDNCETAFAQFKRFYCQALPFTLASVLILAAVLLLLRGSVDLSTFIGIYLVVISSLTVPHLLVVEWMDRREGV
jgi:Brp/Blh family beta-carotene 15,15'-monooxygenase